MPKLAANLSMLFKEVPFLDRFAAAAGAGFRAVEYQCPYGWRSDDFAARARAAGVQILLHNMPRGEAERGEHGTACLPGREARFREDLERAVEYARAVGCTRLHCMAGVAPAGAERAALQAEGMQVLIEPLSARTVAGYFLTGSAQAARTLDEVAAANVLIQHELFQSKSKEEELAEGNARVQPRIGHLQIADVPGRHEPGSGEINFDFLLRHVDAIGYSGWVGCEYNPQGDTAEGLKWAKPYL